MSHMLASINPEAAAAINDDPAPPAPDIGTMVVYIPRPGQTRMGRHEFPALVLGSHDDGSLELMVIMEPEDIIAENRVHRQSHDHPDRCWREIKSEATDPDMMASRLNAMSVRIAMLEDTMVTFNDLQALRDELMGGR